jgi:hypothetical protein
VIETLKFVVPIFLPAGSTSCTQPLDAGIISSFKMHYKKELVHYICDRFDQAKEDPSKKFDVKEINIKRIVPWLANSLEEMSKITIAKCFLKCLKIDCFRIAVQELQKSDTSSIVVDELAILAEKIQTLHPDLTGNEALNLARDYISQSDSFEETRDFILESEGTFLMSEAALMTEPQDEVIVQDPTRFIYHLTQMETYFEATLDVESVALCRFLMEKLESDLNFFT